MLTKNVKIIEMDGLYAKKATKLKTAVRLFCSECMGMDRRLKTIEYPIEDVRKCTDKMCPLYEWRLGKNPYPSKSRVEAGKRLSETDR